MLKRLQINRYLKSQGNIKTTFAHFITIKSPDKLGYNESIST